MPENPDIPADLPSPRGLDPATAQLLLVIQELRQELAALREAQAPPAAVTILRAQELLVCSRARVFELLKEGRLKRAKSVGKATLVTYGSVQAVSHGVPPPGKGRAAGKVVQLRPVVHDDGEELGEWIRKLRV